MLIVCLDLYLAWWEGHSQWPGLRILPHILPGQKQARIHKTNTQKSWYPSLPKKVWKKIVSTLLLSILMLPEEPWWWSWHLMKNHRSHLYPGIVITPDFLPTPSLCTQPISLISFDSHLPQIHTLIVPLDCFSKLWIRNLNLDCLHDSDLEFP